MSCWTSEQMKRTIRVVNSASPSRSDRSRSEVCEFERAAARAWPSMRRVALQSFTLLALTAPLTSAATCAAAAAHGPAAPGPAAHGPAAQGPAKGQVAVPSSITANPPVKGRYASPPISIKGPYASPPVSVKGPYASPPISVRGHFSGPGKS